MYIQGQEELRKVQIVMEKTLKSMESRLPQIKFKLESTAELHKYRGAFAEYEEYILNPSMVHSCQRFKILELVAFTRKMDQILENSKKLAGDSIEDFKR